MDSSTVYGETPLDENNGENMSLENNNFLNIGFFCLI